MSPFEHDDEDLEGEGAELIRQIQEKRGVGCKSCQRILCMHHVLASMVLGSGKAPRCLNCLASLLEESRADLIAHLYSYFQARACYRAAWQWASRVENVDSESIPSCLLEDSRRPTPQTGADLPVQPLGIPRHLGR